MTLANPFPKAMILSTKNTSYSVGLRLHQCQSASHMTSTSGYACVNASFYSAKVLQKTIEEETMY